MPSTGEVNKGQVIENEMIDLGLEKITGEVTGEANMTQVVDNKLFMSELEKITWEVTGEVRRVVLVMQGEMRRQDIQSILEIKHDDYFRTEYISPALASGLIEMTYPEIPNHPRQRYRLTEKGVELQKIWKLGA